ncbi:sulfurtransferase-like selenium metabolism protein YedF [Porphyromonas sp. COT-239 OH1446]|uniref:sulfurtransferase-like selenium metabolism protein YedF n=1 Tax=Porphyromonas sp. COT-239 OH1446 TaxID=1515613 RepID=UPI00052C3D43|nr:sulfurtransferase-like selenium metabolism protein YedF [Porphyromonas sp. COT-239 OH1446]KGN68116.1 hypothetical protein HQ37_07100 [Porphyromonas sp. COT-239 OH1446]
MKTIDTRGKLCPIPLIMLKKGLAECRTGEEICVLTDNATACANLNDYLHELRAEIQQEEVTNSNGETYTELHFSTPETINGATAQAAEPSCPTMPSAETPYGVIIDSDEMGGGDSELGKILMRAFVNALIEMPHMPQFVILYNRGVYLATRQTDTAQTLERMKRERGVDIVCCGTCVDYYGLQGDLQVGRISNMYTIMEIQSRVSRILRP